MTVRLNVNLSDESAAIVRDLAETQGVSATEVIRSSITVYKYLFDEQKAGRRVMTGRGKNKTEVVFL